MSLKVVRHWQRMPRETVDDPSLKVFNTRLDGSLCNLISWVAALPTRGSWDWMMFKITSKSSQSMIQ